MATGRLGGALLYCSRTPAGTLGGQGAAINRTFAVASRTAGVMAFDASAPDATENPANIQTIPASIVARNLLPALIPAYPVWIVRIYW